MLNLGPDKMIVIFVLALVLLGPEKLPGAARRLGELMRVARHYSDGFRQEMNAMVEHVTGLDSPDPDRNSHSAPSEGERTHPTLPEPTVQDRPGLSDGADEHKRASPSASAEAGPI